VENYRGKFPGNQKVPLPLKEPPFNGRGKYFSPCPKVTHLLLLAIQKIGFGEMAFGKWSFGKMVIQKIEIRKIKFRKIGFRKNGHSEN